jgi:hypothetical protein
MKDIGDAKKILGMVVYYFLVSKVTLRKSFNVLICLILSLLVLLLLLTLRCRRCNILVLIKIL